MKPKFRTRISASVSPLSFIVCAAIGAVATAHADQTWTGASDALWSNTGNWSGAAIPGVGDIAIFDVSSSSLTNNATSLNQTFSIKGLKIADPATAVSIAAGNTLTLDLSGVDMSTATQNLTINAPLVLGANQAWNVQTGRTLTVNGGVSGGGLLTKSGAGTVSIGGTNTYTGLTTVTGGALTFSNGAPSTPGTGFNLSGGSVTTVNFTSSADDNLGPVTYSGNATVTSNLSSSRTMSMGTLVVDSGVTGIFNGGGRCSVASGTTATGSGTFRLNIGASALGSSTDSRHDINGNWTNFTGTLELNGTATNSGVRLVANGGNFNGDLSNAAVKLSAGVGAAFNLLGRFGTNGTMSLGSLEGAAGTVIRTCSGSGAGTYSIGNLDTSTEFSGTITNDGSSALSITKVGTGTLTLSGTANNHAGSTTVNEGVLRYNGTKTGTGATAVNSGGTLVGIGTIAGTTSVNSGGILAPGDAGTGNLTFGSLTLNTGGILKLGATPTANKAVVQAGGTLTLTSGVNVDVNGFSTDGTYDIIDITGANLSGTAASAFTATNTSGGKIYTFSSTATAVRMTISSSDPTNFWNVDGGGSWATPTNWTKNPVIPNAPGAIAKFGPGQGGVNTSFSGSFSVTLDDSKTVGLLSFNDDFGSVVTIDAGSPTGNLIMDNSGSPASIVVVAGDHIINTPVVANAQGLGVDTGTAYSLTLNDVVSGTGAALSKSGGGKLTLAANNTYDGNTILSGGVLNIVSDANLGIGGNLRFAGGTLQLGTTLSGVTRSYQISAANNALIDTNGNDFGYDGVISPFSGGTGGLTKTGTGNLTLSGVQTYPGVTTLSGGTLELTTGGSINGTSLNVTAGTFTVAGGTLVTSATSSVTSSGFALSSGSATFTTVNGNTGNPSTNIFLNLSGGTFTAGALSMGRCSPALGGLTTPPANGSNNAGLYVNGATASITGALAVGLNSGGTNSTASARIDSGSLTVDGAISVSIASPDRWSVIDVNGGTFTSTNVATGIQLGIGQTGSVAFLVRDGTATVERFLLQQPALSTETSLVNLTGGTLYIGAGGIVGNNNGGAGVLSVQLGDGILGAKAAWSTALGATLNGTTTIQAADAANLPFDISISGALGGTGGFNKTGTGKLTLSGLNTYSGNTTVTAGMLEVTNDDVFDDASTVSIASGATLNLTHSGTDVVGSLVINGITQPNGVYTFGAGKLQVGTSTPFQAWALSKGLDGTAGKENGLADDPDKDGRTNLSEFAFNGDPLSGSNNGQIYVLSADSDADSPDTTKELILTLAVRKNTPAFTAGAPATAPLIDGINYSIQGSTNLSTFGVTVTPVGFVDPGVALTDVVNYEFRSFSLDGSNGLSGKGFLRASVVAP